MFVTLKCDVLRKGDVLPLGNGTAVYLRVRVAEGPHRSRLLTLRLKLPSGQEAEISPRHRVLLSHVALTRDGDTVELCLAEKALASYHPGQLDECVHLMNPML